MPLFFTKIQYFTCYAIPLKAKPLCVQWFALTCCGQSTLCSRFQGPACRRAWLCGRRIRMPPHRHSVQTNTRFGRNPGTRLNGSINTSWKSKPLSCYQSELSSVPMRIIREPAFKSKNKNWFPHYSFDQQTLSTGHEITTVKKITLCWFEQKCRKNMHS